MQQVYEDKNQLLVIQYLWSWNLSLPTMLSLHVLSSCLRYLKVSKKLQGKTKKNENKRTKNYLIRNEIVTLTKVAK